MGRRLHPALWLGPHRLSHPAPLHEGFREVVFENRLNQHRMNTDDPTMTTAARPRAGQEQAGCCGRTEAGRSASAEIVPAYGDACARTRAAMRRSRSVGFASLTAAMCRFDVVAE